MNQTNNKLVTLIIATLGAFITSFLGSAVNIALPSIGTEFTLDAVLLGWISTSYLLATAIFLVPFGKLADIYGQKKIFTYGVMIYTLASLFAGIASSAEILISVRILQGLGSSMMFGTRIAILTSVIPANERGKALGINVAAVYIGLTTGPFLGGLLTQQLGWRSIFLINIPLGLIILTLILWKLKGEWAAAKGEPFDLIGSIIYGLMLFAVMYGFTLLPDFTGFWVLLLGIAGLVAFIVWELSREAPVLDIKLFRTNQVFAFSNLAALINYSATFAVSFLLSLYLQYIKGLSPQSAGLILLAQPLVQAIFSPVAGRFSDRIEPQKVASVGMALIVAGLCLLVFLTDHTPLEFILASLGFLGLGFALFSSPNTNAVMGSVTQRFYGVASATIATMRLIGQTLSLGIAMLLFSLYMGRIQITPDVYPLFLQSVQVAFIIFAILCFGGIFASLARGKVHESLNGESQ